jgi:hypothetical protein
LKQRKIGLQPVMRDGTEYEFDVCGEMDQENTLQATKSRCPKLSGGVFPKPGKELADALKEWLGTETRLGYEPQADKDGFVDDAGGLQPASAIPQELVSIWKRMCTPRRVVKEFENFRAEVEQLAGSTGVAEYCRILRQHGVDHPKRFKASQPARVCAKHVFELLAELRENAIENESQLPLEATNEHGLVETPAAALER